MKRESAAIHPIELHRPPSRTKHMVGTSVPRANYNIACGRPCTRQYLSILQYLEAWYHTSVSGMVSNGCGNPGCETRQLGSVITLLPYDSGLQIFHKISPHPVQHGTCMVNDLKPSKHPRYQLGTGRYQRRRRRVQKEHSMLQARYCLGHKSSQGFLARYQTRYLQPGIRVPLVPHCLPT
eukprot:689537-Rhodomonas_salina.5